MAMNEEAERLLMMCDYSALLKYRIQPPQPTHNAPKPPEEGDCIGGEGGGV